MKRLSVWLRYFVFVATLGYSFSVIAQNRNLYPQPDPLQQCRAVSNPD